MSYDKIRAIRNKAICYYTGHVGKMTKERICKIFVSRYERFFLVAANATVYVLFFLYSVAFLMQLTL